MDFGARRRLERELAERENRIRMLEQMLVRDKLQSELKRREVLSPELVVKYLEPFIRWEDGKMVVLDEEGNPRVKIVKDDEGRFRTEEMGVGDLVGEFLEAHPHFLPEEEGSGQERTNADEDIDERYQRALEESAKHGRPTNEMLKWMARKYGAK